MQMILKGIFIFVLPVFLFLASLDAYGATITATNCSQSAVQSAITSAASGDTVTIPSGSCTWGSGISIDKKITIQGAGSSSTIITASASGVGFFSINTNVRITGIGFRMYAGTGIGIYNGQGWRIDHCSFTRINPVDLSAYAIFVRHFSEGYPYGLIDNNTFTNTRIQSDRCASLRCQVDAYNNEISFGAADAVYMEDNNFTFTINNNNASDSNRGGRWVARFNTYTNSEIMAHGRGANIKERGTRSWEIYYNTFTSTGNVGSIAPIFLRSGTGFIFDNAITGKWTWTNHPLLSSDRSLSAYGQPCGGTNPMDRNIEGQEGWLCRDQVGAGTDTVATIVTGKYPNEEITWGSQSAAPVYAWGNTTSIQTNGDSYKHIKANRDYYDAGTLGLQTSKTSPFNGTSGVGRGTYDNRPDTCTKGVAYWATDRGSWNKSSSGGQGQLFKCTSTNAWTLYYEPYTYPHPLRSGEAPPPPDIGDIKPPGNFRIAK